MTTSQNDDTLSATSCGESRHPANGSVSMNPNSPGDVARQADEMPQNQASSVPESPGDVVTDDPLRAPGSSLQRTTTIFGHLAAASRKRLTPGSEPGKRDPDP